MSTGADRTDEHVRRAARIVSARAVTEQQLRAKLSPLDDGVWDAVVDRCRYLGLVDDDGWATSYLDSRIRRGFGPRRIQQDLRKAGIDAGLVADRITGAIDDGRFLDAAMAEVRRVVDRHRDDLRERARVERRLIARGFTRDMIADAVAAVE